MTHAIQNFSEGACRSFLDGAVYKIKVSQTVTKRSTTIDCFFRPIITSLFDIMQVQSIQKRGMALLNKGRFFKKVSTSLSNQIFLVFLLAKTTLNVTTSLARGALNRNTMHTLRTLHDGMESFLPLASAVIAIASMNLVYISAYFLCLGLSYLGDHDSLSREMNSVCQYSSTILGLASFLYLGTSNPKIF